MIEGDADDNRHGPRYLVIMVKDERLCGECEAIEAFSAEIGGLTFPFEFKGKRYGNETVERGVEGWETGAVIPSTFHYNCRCVLVPVAGLRPDYDELDKMVHTVGSLGYSTREESREILGDRAVDEMNANIGRVLRLAVSTSKRHQRRRARVIQKRLRRRGGRL